MKESFQNRLLQAMKYKGYKQVDVIEKSKAITKKTGVKITKTDLSQYVNGKTEPGNNKLYVLSKTLNVNEAWLMGYEVPMNEETSKLETVAAHMDDDLTEEEILKVQAYIAGLKANRK